MPKVIYFGSSMNPPTIIHRAMVEALIKDNPGAIILVSPVADPLPEFRKADFASYEDRCAMARLAFADLKEVFISNIDDVACKEKKSPQGTFVTVNEFLIKDDRYKKDLAGEVPDIVLGGDTYEDFFAGKWYRVDEILSKNSQIHVFGRDGNPLRNPAEIINSAKAEVQQISEDLAAKLKALEREQQPEKNKEAIDKIVADLKKNNDRGVRLGKIENFVNSHEEIMRKKIEVHAIADTYQHAKNASSTRVRKFDTAAEKYLPNQAVKDYIDDPKHEVHKLYYGVKERVEKEKTAADIKGSTKNLSVKKMVTFFHDAQEVSAKGAHDADKPNVPQSGLKGRNKPIV